MFATSFVQTLTFAIAAMICVTGALGVVALRNPVHNALSLVATLFGVAVLFLSLIHISGTRDADARDPDAAQPDRDG